MEFERHGPDQTKEYQLFSVDAIHLIFFEFRNYKFGSCLHIVMTEAQDLDVIQHGGIHRINYVTSRENDL